MGQKAEGGIPPPQSYTPGSNFSTWKDNHNIKLHILSEEHEDASIFKCCEGEKNYVHAKLFIIGKWSPL